MLTFALAASTLGALSAGAHQTTQGGAVVDYSQWERQDGISCCGTYDCFPTEWRFHDGQEQILVGETWRPVEGWKVLPFTANDEAAHVCTRGGSTEPDAVILCIMRPGFGA